MNISTGDKFYKEGEALLLKDQVDSYKMFQEAITYYKKSQDSSNISKSLIYQSIAQKYSGDINGAEITLVEALKMMKENDENLYSVYGTLGDLKYDQKEYSEATIWYDKALKSVQDEGGYRYNILNNMAAAAFRQKKYHVALQILENLDKQEIEDIILKYRIKENIEYVRWLSDNDYPAEDQILKLLQLKIESDDSWGMNASYAHLAEINQVKNPEQSLYYARQMLETAQKNKSPDDRLEAMSKIMLVGNSSQFKDLFKEYAKLSDSIQNSRNNYKTKFAYIKYNTKKKEFENQELQAENKIERLKTVIGVGVLSGMLIAGVFWYKRRKRRLEQEKKLEVKNTELKYSKNVHDVVANGLYHLMVDIENNSDLSRGKILNDLEKMYEESRDISHENLSESDFYERFGRMINSYSSAEQKVIPIKYSEEVWEDIPQSLKSELFYVIREILINMKKHSGAQLVILKFERDNHSLQITYTDNGKGIENLDTQKGSGIRNTENRIGALNGEIIFEQNPNGGLIIKITVPTDTYYV
ncbi:hypothetical protein [Chryseobacterium sp. Leaf180]|uniref:hypothetical protein n=1 Tax=Chryseobacterium sp. Leaf180 TaxID=1736289 RepID=UPI0010396D29|nr:hypothetical protein [Chryseobacterium sp. Leaf180]